MWVIVGLGNPGPQYERSRHNAGFMAIDQLARQIGAGNFRSKHGGLIASAHINTSRVVLFKPMEYMNNSGFAVSRCLQFHDVSVDSMIVIHDEIDLPFGTLRLKSGGGHGGHNGLRSIITQLGENGFSRVRIGMGKPAHQGQHEKITGHVLGNLPPQATQELESLLDRACQSVETIVQSGIVVAMNQYNSRQSNNAKTN